MALYVHLVVYAGLSLFIIKWANLYLVVCVLTHITLHLYFKVQKGHHECLSVGTSLYLNVEIEPKTKWCGDGETEPMENLHLGNGISVSAIEKWLSFHKYASYGKMSNY